MNSSFVSQLLTLSGISSAFGHLVDQGRAIECVDLFAPDAQLIFAAGSPKPGTLNGLEAIRAFLTSRQAMTHVTTRHLATNFRMDWDGGAEARLGSLLTVFRSENATRQPIISVVCDIEEIFARDQAGRWQIRERLTRPVFMYTQ